MPLPITQLKQQGLQAYERKQYAEALEQFQALLGERPGFADIRHLAGLCLFFLGRLEEALEQFDLALQTNPDYVEAHINRALLLQDLGRYDEAQEAFERASATEIEAHGRFPAAVTAKLANAHASVGDLYLDAGAHEEAADQYRVALGLRPKFHDIRNKYAVALLGLARADEAAQELERILDWNPRFIAARLNLGLAYFRLGRSAEAGAEWRTCAAQQPDNAQVRAYLAVLDQAAARQVRG
jgi:tetratricopeptide (TPR) repeat protein